MPFRPLTALETKILTRILSIDDVRNNRFLAQVEDLWAEPDGSGGSIFLSAPDEQGRLERRELTHSVPASGTYRGSQKNGPIQFIVFHDDLDRLSSLEVIYYDGDGLDGAIHCEDIVVDTEAM